MVMGLPPVGAQIVLAGYAAFNNTVAGVIRGFDSITKSVAQTSTAVTALSATMVTAFAGASAAAIKMGTSYEQLVQYAAVAAKTTTADTQRMSDSVINLTRNATTGINQLGQGLGEYVRAGGTVKGVTSDVYKQINNLTIASAGELGLEQAILLVTGAMGAFGIEEQNVARITDSLVAAANASSISYKDLYRAFPQAASAAAALGYTVEDLSSALGILGQNYIRNSDAGTALKQMMTGLMNPSKKAIEDMKKWGISLWDAQGNALPLVAVIDQLHTAFGNMDDTLDDATILTTEKGQALARIFGSDAIRPAIIFAKTGSEAFMKFQSTIASTDTDKMAKEMMKPLQSQLKILTNNFEAFAVAIATKVTPVINDFVTNVNTMVQSIDIKKIELIGEAIGAAFSGKGQNALKLKAETILSPETFAVFKSFLDLMNSIYNGIFGKIIPAFDILFETVTGGASASNLAITALNGLKNTIDTVSSAISVGVTAFSNIYKEIQSTQTGAAILQIIFQGLLALPFVGLALVVTKLSLAVLALGGTALIASVAVGAVLYAIANWDTIGIPIVKELDKQMVQLGNDIVIIAGPLTTLASLLIILTPLFQGIAYSAVAITAMGAAFNYVSAAIAPLVPQIDLVKTTTLATTLAVAEFPLVFGTWLAIPTIIRTITDALSKIGPALYKGAVEGVEQSLPILLNTLTFIGTIGTAIGSAFTWAVSNILADLKSISDGVSNTVLFVTDILYLMIPGLDGIIGGFKRVAESAYNDFAKNVQSAANDTFTSISNNIPGFIANLWSIANAGIGVAASWAASWGGIDGITAQILNWVAEKIGQFINWLKTVPLIGKFVEGAATGFAATATGAGAAAQGAVNTVKNAGAEIEKYTAGIKTSYEDINKQIEAQRRELEANRVAWENEQAAKRNEQDAADAIKKQNEALDAQRKKLAEAQGKGLSFPEAGGGGGGAESEADKLKALTKEIMALLSDLPVMTKDAAEYLAKIGMDAPERLAPMLAALKNAKDLIGQLAQAERELLTTELAIAQSEIRMGMLTAQASVLEAKNRLIEVGYEAQLLELNKQLLAIDMLEAPIKAQIKTLETEINRLTRANLDIALDRAKANLVLLPLKKQQADLEAQIEKLNRKNYEILIAQAQTQLSILPAQQQIARIEQEREKLNNNLLALQEKQQQLVAGRNVTLVQRQIDDANKQLEQAWQDMNVPAILALESKLNSLDKQKSAADDAKTAIDRQIEDTQYLNDIQNNQYDQQVSALNKSMESLNTYLLSLQQQLDLQDAINKVTSLGYEQEKQAIEDLMEPTEKLLSDLQYKEDLEKATNEIAVIGLEQQKRALEDLLIPLEAQRAAIELVISQINMEKQAAEFSNNMQLAQLHLLQAEEGVRRAELDLTKAQQDAVFADLIMQFTNTLKASGAFTLAEATEVAKRLGFWNDQVNKLMEVYNKFAAIRNEANEVTKAIDAIPKDVTITITTVHKDVYQSSGGGAGAGGNPTNPVLQKDMPGRIPGPAGMPQLAIVHGQEKYLGIGSVTPTVVRVAESQARYYQPTSNTTNNFNVNANYQNNQSPFSIRRDLSGLLARTRI